MAKSDAEDFPDINSQYHNIDKVNGSKDEHIYEDQFQSVCRSNAAPCPQRRQICLTVKACTDTEKGSR